MNMPRKRLQLAMVLVGLLFCSETLLADNSGGPLRLTLPTEFYAVVGDEMNIYFDNIVLTETPEAYRFTVTGANRHDMRTTLDADPQGG